MILLDTHIWLEFMNSNQVSDKLLRLLEDTSTPVFVSHASIWELNIKASIGKIRIPDDLVQASQSIGILPIPTDLNSINLIRNLPLHHRDPFDRILICTAITQNLLLLSRDSQFKSYQPELNLESNI